MGHFRYLTAGESHGPSLVAIVEGVPAGLEIREDDIYHELQRRQMGHGRGGRMKIEKDRAQIRSGVRFGKTLGSPIALVVENLDWKNWQERMAIEGSGEQAGAVTIPRPGHADLPGAIKYRHTDIRNVLERASARETAVRVAAGSIARRLLDEFGITIVSHVLRIHGVEGRMSLVRHGGDPQQGSFDIPVARINEIADSSPVRCLDPDAEAKMVAVIDEAINSRDTVGGIFEVAALNVPVGLGSHVHWDRKLDGRIAAAMMSLPAMKGVEIGLGFESAATFGSGVHDEIYYGETAAGEDFYRRTNHAGGLEGGVSNGLPIVVRVAMKPLSTLMRPLDSVDLQTKEPVKAHRERSDVCAVPAASVIGEAMLALVLADAFLEKFGGDSVDELKEVYKLWQEHPR
jgi:chorismate synthase